jgi:hypothetical protein
MTYRKPTTDWGKGVLLSMFSLYHVINFAFHLAQGYLWASLGHCNVKTFFCSLLEEFIGGVVCHWISRVSRRCQSTTQFIYWNCVVLAQIDPWCWPFSLTEEWLLPTFCSILIFASHTHLASLHIMLLNNLSYFTDELVQSLPSAATHLLSLTTELCPGTR